MLHAVTKIMSEISVYSIEESDVIYFSLDKFLLEKKVRNFLYRNLKKNMDQFMMIN